MENNGDEFDVLLDAALRSYGGRDAPLGMESRIVRRALHAPVRRWWPLLSVPGLALVVAAVLLLSVTNRVDVPPPSEVRVEPIGSGPVRVPAPVGKPTRAVPVTSHRAAPMLIRMNPETARAFFAVVHDEVQPLIIPPIRIIPTSATARSRTARRRSRLDRPPAPASPSPRPTSATS